MNVAEFLQQVCDAQGPSQALAMDVIEGMSPIGFTMLVAEIALHQRLMNSLKQAASNARTRRKDRHPVTHEPLEAE